MGESGERKKIPLLTFASDQGLNSLLENDEFAKNNRDFFEKKVSELVVVYTRNNEKYATKEKYAKSGVEKIYPIQIDEKIMNDAQKIYETLVRKREDLTKEPAYVDINHGRTEMRLVGPILHLANPKIILLKKEGKMDDTGKWITETVFLRPYAELYIIRKNRELVLAHHFFLQCDFQAAKNVLETLKGIMPEEKLAERKHIEYLIAISNMFYFWDRFAHAKGPNNALRYASEAKKIAENTDNSDKRKQRLEEIGKIINFLKTFEVLEKEVCESGEMLADRFHNAQIRIEHGLYDDAVARFYSLAEAIAKKRLYEQHGIDSGNVVLKKEHEEILSKSLQGREMLERLRPNGSDSVKLQLVSTYRLLACLEDPLGNAFFEKTKGKEGGFDANAKFDPKINLLDKRNQSILAHGKNTITKEDAESWEKLCEQLLREIGVDESVYPSLKKESSDTGLLLSPFE